MATLQISIDDTLKNSSDALFSSLGLDTPTAVRIFLTAAVEQDGIPFLVSHRNPDLSLQQAIDDTRNQRNLYGPFDSAGKAIASMLED